jgi:hypothetical protein
VVVCVSLFGAVLVTAGWLLGVSYLDYLVAQYRPFEVRGHVPVSQQLAVERSLALPWDISRWLVSGLLVFCLALVAALIIQFWGLLLVTLVGAALLTVLTFSDWSRLQQWEIHRPSFQPPRSIPLQPPGPSAWLECVQGERRGERFQLNEFKFRIGRDSKSALHLRDKTVSRKHAKIVHANGHFYLQDYGSRSGTFLNGKQTPAHPLRDGDKIKIGESLFVFRASPDL